MELRKEKAAVIFLVSNGSIGLSPLPIFLQIRELIWDRMLPDPRAENLEEEFLLNIVHFFCKFGIDEFAILAQTCLAILSLEVLGAVHPLVSEQQTAHIA